jgi:uncharacterized protein (DUF433 family)
MATEAQTTRTEHPHIVMTPGTCGGRPRIDGTRISVESIARYENDGVSVATILESLPHLTRASVYDALGYYHDHKAEMDAEIAENTPEKLAEKYQMELGEHRQVIFKDLSTK